MPEETTCPFLIRELYENKTAVGIKCQGTETILSLQTTNDTRKE